MYVFLSISTARREIFSQLHRFSQNLVRGVVWRHSRSVSHDIARNFHRISYESGCCIEISRLAGQDELWKHLWLLFGKPTNRDLLFFGKEDNNEFGLCLWLYLGIDNAGICQWNPIQGLPAALTVKIRNSAATPTSERKAIIQKKMRERETTTVYTILKLQYSSDPFI